MMLTRAVRCALAVVAVGSLALTGCGSPAAGGGQADSPRKAENRAVLIARQDPGTLDYTTSPKTAVLMWIPGNVVEPLLQRTADAEIGPGIADFKVDASRKTYVFTVGENKFSDGSAITAADVLYSLETMKSSPVANNSGAYAQVESMAVTGVAEVTVKLKQPSQAFLQGMAGVAGSIQPKAAASSVATKPIGSGPYQLEEYTLNSRMVFSKNPNYQGPAPALSEIEVRIITDGAAVINKLKSGEADAVPLVASDLFERIKSEGLDKTLTLIENPKRGEKLYVPLNAGGKHTKDPLVRQAIARSLDRGQIITALNADWAMTPTCGYGLASDPWFAEESASTCPYPSDAAAAKELATTLGLNSAPTEFVSLSDVPDLSLPADVLIEQFKASGIQIERNAIDLARYSQLIFQGRPPQFEISVMSGPEDITQFVCPDPKKASWTTYCSAEFTKLVEKADTAPTVKEYSELLKAANEQLKKDAVIVPLAATAGIGLAHPGLKGTDAPSMVNAEVRFASLAW